MVYSPQFLELLVKRRRIKKKHTYLEKIRRWFKYHHFKLIRINDTPENLAWSVVIGVVVGIAPTFGLGIPIILLLSYLFGINRFAGIIGLIVLMNPWTASFFWIGSYVIGAVILGNNWRRSIEDFKNIGSEIDWNALINKNWNAWIASITKNWNEWTSSITKGLVWPYLLGNLVLNIIFGIAAYYITLKIVRAYKERQEERRQGARPPK